MHLFFITGYIESFNDTKDICVFTSKTSEAEAIGEFLKANCCYTLVATEFSSGQELANVKRQWNTPHSADAMPVLGTVLIIMLLIKHVLTHWPLGILQKNTF